MSGGQQMVPQQQLQEKPRADPVAGMAAGSLLRMMLLALWDMQPWEVLARLELPE